MRKCLFLTFVLCLGLQSQAQKKVISSLPYSAEVVNEYITSSGNQLIIYNGKEEAKYPSQAINHPFLDTSEYREGIISFDGVVYPNIRVRLNVHSEELIVQSPTTRLNVVIPADRVDYAYISPYYIIPHDKSDGYAELPEGYYVLLHDGKHQVLKRETAFMQSGVKGMTMEVSFKKQTKYYIYKDGKYTNVTSQRSVLKLFDSKKRELQQFIKQSNLNYRKFPEAYLVAVADYYETLER
ncbi:hypothetical protein LJC57_04320 [Parabacteroides sp. OttesenSCG-928-G07]|nr:hypothetical protein [Parabacteroides sp. OttesenSCG-928-G21]MDL2277798.1 hypothetical protein [Parabacteroides sp. OttesenSCG-928-G07]